MYETTRPSAQVKMGRGLKTISAILLSSLLLVASFVFFADEGYAQALDVAPFGTTGGIFQLEKASSAPTEVSAGDLITFTVTLKSNQAITGGTLTDTMTLNTNLSLNGAVTATVSAGSSAPINTLSPFDGDGQPVIAPLFPPQAGDIVIPANGQIDYIIPAIVSSNIIADTLITNTAQFTHPTLSKLLVVVVTHTVKIPDPIITKTLVAIPAAPPLNIANLAAAGDTVTYLIEYANNGGAGSNAVVLTETLPFTGVTNLNVTSVTGPTPTVFPLSGNVFTMTLPSFPQGSGSLNISFDIPASAISPAPIAGNSAAIGPVTNIITMTVSPGGTVDDSNPDLLIQPVADLTVTKQVITDTALAGSTDRLTFTLTITNAGALTASVFITDIIPFSITNVLVNPASTLNNIALSGEQSVVTFISNSITNTTSVITYGFEVPSNVAAGTYGNSSSLYSEQDSTPTPAIDTANFIVTNAMTLTVITNTTNFTDVSVGDLISYTVVISNAGPSDIVTGTATITDSFIISPAGSVSLRLMNIASIPAILSDISPGTLFDTTPVVLASNFPLAANDTLTLTLEFIIDDVTAYPVNITNTVAIYHPDALTLPSARITNSTPITIANSPPTIETMASADTAQPGETITYTISISRAGSIEYLSGNSETISIREALPDGVTYVGGTAGVTYDSDNNLIIYSGAINGTAPFSINYTVTVNSDTVPGTILQHSTMITISDELYETSTVVAVPDLDPLHTLLLVYAGGDNNLDMERLHNNLEMNADNPNVTALLVIDGPGEDDAYLYRIQHDTNPNCDFSDNYLCRPFPGVPPLYTEGENVWRWLSENTGSPHSLASFITGAIHAYPNHDQTVLVLAGHGNGWAPDTIPAQARFRDGQARFRDGQYTAGGMISDESSGDALSTYEFSTALDSAYTVTQEKLGLIYMDACSMQMSEVAYEIRNYADYLLGSENTTWASFAYDAHLADIDETTKPKEIAERWLENEAKYFRTGDYPFTLSVIDLKKMEAVLEAENVLAQALMNELELNPSTAREAIRDAFDNTEMFDSDYDYAITPVDNYGDLYSFAQQIENGFDSPAHSDIRQAAEALQIAVTETVVLEDHEDGRPWEYPNNLWAWGTLGGISKYLHFNLEHDEPKRRFYNEAHLASAEDGLWDDLIALYWNYTAAPTNHPVCPDDCDDLGKPLPLRPEVTSPNSWTDFNNVPLLFDPSGGEIRAVQFNLDLGDSCLVLDPTDSNGNELPDAISLELPADFELVSASYNGTMLDISIADQEQPYTSLPKARIAMMDFDASACTLGKSSELIFTSTSTKTDGNPLDEVTASGTIEFPFPTCDGPISTATSEIAAGTTGEIIRDNAATDGSVIISGNDWVSSTAILGFHDADYLHNNSGTGSVKFMVPSVGEHEVFVRWTQHQNRATNAPIDVVHAGGTANFLKNQRQNGGEWISLGMYTFGSDDYVEIRTADTDGHVIADAVRFVSASSDCPQIRFSPSQNIMGISELIRVEVYADNVTDLYGVQFEIEFDPTVIQVVNANSVPPTQIAVGNFFLPDTVSHNGVDKTNGLIRYTATLRDEKLGVDGSGPIAVITFKAENPGTSPLTFKVRKLSDPQSVSIKHMYGDGEVRVITDTLDLAGQVVLERRNENRDNNDGASVCVANLCTETDEDGSYLLQNVPLTGTVIITHQSYLSTTYEYIGARATVVELPDVKLLGGDYNQDGIIDLQDAALTGLAWERKRGEEYWDEHVDVTDSNVIDVNDMTAIQFNWGETASSPWGNTTPSVVAAFRRNVESLIRPWVNSDLMGDTSTSIYPAMDILSVGSTTDLEIRVNNVSNLYGFTVEINFDPTIAQVVDLKESEDGIQVTQGEFLDTANQFVLVNKVDNDKGKIELSVIQTLPATGKSGSGMLGMVRFETIAEGRNEIQLTRVQLINDERPNPQVMATDTDHGVLLYPFNLYLPTVVR